MRWWIRSLSEGSTSATTRRLFVSLVLAPSLVLGQTAGVAPVGRPEPVKTQAQPPPPPAPTADAGSKPDGGTFVPPGPTGNVLPGLQNGNDAGTIDPSRPEDPITSEARLLSDQAKIAYDGGKFREALKLYADAYRKRPLPGFLFNIGQCHRQLGAFDRAAFFFGRYLDVYPEAPNGELARSLLLESEQRAQLALDDEKKRIEKQLAEANAAREKAEVDAANTRAMLLAAPPRPNPEGPGSGLFRQWWFWAAVGGAAVAVTGTAILAQPHPRTPSLGTVDLR